MIPALFLAITAIKLALAGVWGWTNDIPGTLVQAEAFLEGRVGFSPASVGGQPAIFPLGYYLLASGSLLASQWTGLPFAFWIKVPAILADLAVALMLNAMRRGGERLARAYLINPVTFLLSVYHGQLHTVATAGVVLALWASDRQRFWLSGLALGLAASVRHYFGILIVPLLMTSRMGRVPLLVSFGLVGFLTNAPLISQAYHVQLAAPHWHHGAWGYTMLFLQGPRLLELCGLRGAASLTETLDRVFHTYGPAVYWVWAVVFCGWVWRRSVQGRLADLWRVALFFCVGHYTISPGFGVQWLIWSLPLWLVVNRREAIGYSALAGLFIAGTYWQASLNAKYGLFSITANLQRLAPLDLLGVCVVGAVGLLTWLYCARAAWRLAWG